MVAIRATFSGEEGGVVVWLAEVETEGEEEQRWSGGKVKGSRGRLRARERGQRGREQREK